MSIKALQDYTYYAKYARYNKDKKRRETWGEAIDRVMDMHLRKYPEAREEIEWIIPLMKEKRFLGSQRALQFGGRPIEKVNARIYNCCASYCNRIEFFQECFWLLLCGCGTGFSVQKHHIDKIPAFHNMAGKGVTRCWVVEDSIEGWADALGVLLATYIPHPQYHDWKGCIVEFDYKNIRPAGSSLSSGAGKAPGPEPLKKALAIIKDLLDKKLEMGLKKLRPIDAYDICMHASDAVLSGGVRRSATLCLFSPDDEEMAKAKTGNWRYENPQRGRSNNSALLIRGETTKEDFLKFINYVKEFGEPGFIWAEDSECLFNPCVEVGLFAYHENEQGELISGWEFCNLCEINGKKIKCKEDFALAVRGAAILGTLQAGYTDFHYLGEISKKIVEKEALLGISITGMMDNPDIIFDSETQKEMAQLAVKTNTWMAKKIGINPAARCTCVKPSGTASCVLGTANGIHAHHARKYFRRVQGNVLEPVLQHFKQYNSFAVEKSVWAANDTDEVITFCVEVPPGAKTKNQVPAIELLEHVKLTQQNWVAFGKTKSRCSQPWLTHNVSNTINVRPDEWEEVAEYIFKNRKWFAGISLLPQSGDLDYPQAPFTTVHTPKELLQMYGDASLLASGLIVDGLACFDNNLWKACDIVMGLGEPLDYPEELEEDNLNLNDRTDWQDKVDIIECRKDWVRRVKQFANRYLEGDVRKCCYMMKETNNWKLWMDLQREYKDVPYEELIEEDDNTRPIETIACAGGACSII